MLTFALESLIYCLYNNEAEQLGIEYDISAKIEEVTSFIDDLVKEVGIQYSTRLIELKALYDDYCTKKLPIYTVEFLYPYEPILDNYVFDLSPCFPYISLEVKKEPREKDNFTRFAITAYGLIKPDSFWKGPKWETREKFPPISKSLNVVNMLLLQAVKASPGKMILPYHIEQVSTVSMFQYRWDKSEPILGGTISGTDFHSQWVGNNAQWHKYTDEELHQLNDALIGVLNSKPFVTVFHHATNLLSAGFYSEAFLLLCSCGEGMTYHWCEEIAKKHGLLEAYLVYSHTRVSKCDLCGYFTGKKGERPCGEMEPTLFSDFAYLREHGCLSKEDEKKVKSLLARIRDDQLRNKTTHGSNYDVSKYVADQSLQALLSLQELFIDIINRPTEESK